MREEVSGIANAGPSSQFVTSIWPAVSGQGYPDPETTEIPELGEATTRWWSVALRDCYAPPPAKEVGARRLLSDVPDEMFP